MHKILYIDDDQALCALVRRRFEREGIAVVCAHDGESGIAALAREKGIDVVALDLNMPGMSGIETLERINRIPGNPPVVVVTGTQDSRTAVVALKCGASDYVVKQVDGDFTFLLKNALQAAVDSMRMRRAKEAAEAEVRAARDRFEALAAERALLMREVNHRVGNSLQLIASMLTLQANATDDEGVREALTDATGRVLAVAQLHRRLYTSDNVQSVAVDQYLAALIDDLRRSSESTELAHITLTADPVSIEPDRAVAVGVIANELVTNALKYAYPDRSGEIRVALLRMPGNRARLIVEDDGVGMAPQAGPQSTGLGRRIIRAMGEKLGATIDVDRSHEGTRVVVAFAIDMAKAAPRPAA